ncbi:MAG: hypothetical protein EB059_10935, partial [Alphaproteobacteria bacterium]|nr:hypothetical protein [Alphaproteobacteria bacterium]
MESRWTENRVGPARGKNSLVAQLAGIAPYYNGDLPLHTSEAFASARISLEDIRAIASQAAARMMAENEKYHYYYTHWPESFPYLRIEQRPEYNQMVRQLTDALVAAVDRKVGHSPKKNCTFEGVSYGEYHLANISWGALYSEAAEIFDSPEAGKTIQKIIAAMDFQGPGNSLAEEHASSNLLTWSAVKIRDALPHFNDLAGHDINGIQIETEAARALRRKHRVFDEHATNAEKELEALKKHGASTEAIKRQEGYLKSLRDKMKDIVTQRQGATEKHTREKRPSDDELQNKSRLPMQDATTGGTARRYMQGRSCEEAKKTANQYILYEAVHDLANELSQFNDRVKMRDYFKVQDGHTASVHTRLFVASRILAGHEVQEKMQQHHSWDSPDVLKAAGIVASAADAPMSLLLT